MALPISSPKSKMARSAEKTLTLCNNPFANVKREKDIQREILSREDDNPRYKKRETDRDSLL
jgi:hypothetical protein